MSRSSIVLKNSFFLYFKFIITTFISLYVTKIILRTLGASDFGIFNLVAGAVSMLLFLNTSMAVTSQRFMSLSLGEGNIHNTKSTFYVSKILHYIIALIIIAILEISGIIIFKYFLNIPDDRVYSAKIVYQIMIISTSISVIVVPFDALLNAHENMTFYSIIGILEGICKLILAYFLIKTDYDKLIIYSIGIASISIVSFTTKMLYCKYKYLECQHNNLKHLDFKTLKMMTTFAGWSLLGSSTSIITMQGISIITNNFLGVIINAAQGIANQVSGQLMSFSTIMLKALNPIIVKSYGSNDPVLMMKTAILGNKIAFTLFSIIGIPFIIEMNFICKLWLDQPPEYTVIFCRLQVIRLIFLQLTESFLTTINATGKIRNHQIASSLIYLSVLPLSFLLLKMQFSVIYIYILLILMVIGLMSERIYFTYKLCNLNIKYFIKEVFLKCSGLFIIVFALSILPTFIINESIIRLAITICISSSTMIIFYFLYIASAREKEIIRNALTILIKRFKYD